MGSTGGGGSRGAAISDRWCSGPEEDDWRVKLMRWTLLTGRMNGWKIWKKFLKVLQNYLLGVCAKIFKVGLSGVSIFAPNSLVLRENAVSG